MALHNLLSEPYAFTMCLQSPCGILCTAKTLFRLPTADMRVRIFIQLLSCAAMRPVTGIFSQALSTFDGLICHWRGHLVLGSPVRSEHRSGQRGEYTTIF
jgi:hypothetical protein